jgi:hypothetical protein
MLQCLLLSLYNINADFKLESVSVQLPSVPIESLDQITNQYLLPAMDARQTGFLRLPSDTIRLATKINKLVPVYLPREASQSRTSTGPLDGSKRIAP